MKTPRTFKTSYPVSPNCDSCDALITGVDGAQAVTVCYPTRNPKRVKSVSYCIHCTPYRPQFTVGR